MKIFGKKKPLLTNTRKDFIDVFRTLAKGINQSFLLNTEKPPVISVIGGFQSGKSLVVEAMMKTLAGQDMASTLESERDHMFLEKYSIDAVMGVSGIFNLAGDRTIRQVFINNAVGYVDFDQAEKMLFHKYETGMPTFDGGAVFLADKRPLDSESKKRCWISIGIQRHWMAEGSDREWERTTTIVVNNKDLWTDPSFKKARKALSATGAMSGHSHCGFN